MKTRRTWAVPVLRLVIAVLVIVIGLGSFDIYREIWGRDVDPDHLTGDDFLKYVLKTAGCDGFNYFVCLSKLDKIVENAGKIAASENVAAEEKAGRIFDYLWERKVFRSITSDGPDLPVLLAIGEGNKLSAVCLYVYLLEQFDCSYQMYYCDSDIKIVVGTTVVDISSPAGFRGPDESPGTYAGYKPSGLGISGESPGAYAGVSLAADTAGKPIGISFLGAAACYIRACRELCAHNYQGAIGLSDRAIAMQPGYGSPYLCKGLALKKSGNKLEALPCLEKAVKLDPERVSAFLHYGSCLYESGNLEKAHRIWTRAYELAERQNKGKYKEIVRNNLDVLRRENQYIPLEQETLVASRITNLDRIFDISTFEKKLRKSNSMKSLDQYETARTVFYGARKFLDFEYWDGADSVADLLNDGSGNCATFSILLALLLKRSGVETDVMTFGNHAFLSFNYKGRRVDIETTSAKGFDVDHHRDLPGIRRNSLSILPSLLYHNYATDCLQNNRVAQAIFYCRKALEEFPESALTYNTLASCYLELGDLDRALKEQKNAVSYDPCYAEFYLNLAALHLVRDGYKDAARCLNKARYFSRFSTDSEAFAQSVNKLKKNLLAEAGFSEIADLIELPLKVKNKQLFKRYVTRETEYGLYRVDFEGDREAYKRIGLGDLIEEDIVMIVDSEKKLISQANMGFDGNYYTDSGCRVIIDTDTVFYIPLEKTVDSRW